MSAAASVTDSDFCSVCMDTYNKSTRTKSQCPACSTGICRKCLQTYALSELREELPCVNRDCDRIWDRDFLDTQFTRSFALTTYKEYRESVLLDRERSRLPETQRYVEEMRRAHVENTELRQRIRELQNEIDELQTKIYQNERCIGRHGLRESGGITKSERREFIRACPASDCRGFLSSAWKCGICNLWTCPDCQEVRGESKDSPHTCDPGKVASAKLIERETRPCPKCSARITKLEGCNQMWCTMCNTGFDWATGKLATGPIHNPHYFAWLQRAGGAAGGAGAPAAGAAAGGCGNWWEDDRRVRTALRHRTVENNFLLEAWRLVREYQDTMGRRRREWEEECRLMRIQYLQGALDQETWKKKLQQNEKNSRVEEAIRQVKELYVNTMHDIVLQTAQEGSDIPELYRQACALVEYCNDSFARISQRFGRKAEMITMRI